MKYVVVMLLAWVMIVRFIGAMDSWQQGIDNPLLSYAFIVVFPASLAWLLLLMPPTYTKEGLLMRFGTILHLLLMLYIPSFALYLALGFPVVFLVVELYMMNMPQHIADPLERLVVA
ncbi:MAG: hypothetical protein EAY76_00585 [Alphaproteobacteria bacterium]|nr:MAG: hypothetical protein EAY76_00585 [Alphaproteobacteria bacterium]TAF76075.1 MAG: hypothetical protein EAZ52_05115 [Alphaproteobacteria bacterium]